MHNHAALIVAICIAGCSSDEKHMSKQPDSIREAQVQAVNNAILANHPHFTEGQPIEVSLTATALDFMIGRPVVDFRDVFSAAEKPVDVRYVETKYADVRMHEWMVKLQGSDDSTVRFYLLFTKIGLTYGYEAQEDFLLVAVAEDQVMDYRLFAITEY